MGLGIVRAPPRSHADHQQRSSYVCGHPRLFLGLLLQQVGWAKSPACFVMRGQKRVEDARNALMTRASISFAKRLFAKADGLPGHKRVTRVFNALCPAMTACEGRVCA